MKVYIVLDDAQEGASYVSKVCASLEAADEWILYAQRIDEDTDVYSDYYILETELFYGGTA